jgi:hypothetical protein
MTQDIKQVHWGAGIQFFKKDFLKRWKLDEYNNPNEPSLFVGLYDDNDRKIFSNHKSYKLLYFAGIDLCHQNLTLVANSPNTICIGYGPDWLYQVLDNYKIPYSKTRILLKSFDDFTPSPLGENIYVYKGLKGNRPSHYKWEEIVKPLQQVFGEDRIIYTQNLPLNELKENYYKDCFVYVRPNPMGGGTAMFELGHMGRRTLTNQHTDFSICSGFKNINELLDLIMEESKKIGTLQPQVAEELKSMFDHEGKWLNLNNYEKWK